MLKPWILIVFSLLYVSVLFAIAYYGDNLAKQHKVLSFSPLIYSLSLAVYCTSWTYYGAVGSASTRGWEFLAIYLGPFLLFVFGYPFLKRIASICVENNITTIADFIASRYGKAQSLAVLVTFIACMGTLPYIALQLKAVASSYDVITAYAPAPIKSGLGTPFLHDTGFIVALVMAVFSILFGTRYVNTSEHHEGIILAIAFESVVKLFALICLCLFAVYFVFDGPADLINQALKTPVTRELLLTPELEQDFFQLNFLSNTLLACAAIFCLPRQFHVAFVEVRNTGNMARSRWLFPLYLLITSMVIVPITLVGLLQLSGKDVSPDMFVLTIPMMSGNDLLALLVFIGGLSAATGMVIIAVITLSTMVCNDMVMPVLFKIKRFRLRERTDITAVLLQIRRLSIIAILLLSYFYYRYIDAFEALASIGLVSFVAAIQFAPAIVGGVYWKKGTRQGATNGLIAGFCVWLYTLFLPTLDGTGWLPHGFVEYGPWGISQLKPYALLGFDQWSPITHALILSLAANIGCYLYFSLTRKSDLVERIQAARFTQTEADRAATDGLPWWSTVAVGELRVLAEKFIGEKTTHRAFAEYARRRSEVFDASEKADAELIAFTERLLAGAIGASSARLMISSVLKKKDLPIEDVFSIVDEASQAVHFNQELLNNTMEHIDQGISVVNENLELVAWNNRYLELYKYPQDYIRIGRPVVDLIRHNALLGEFGPGDVEAHVEKRLQRIRDGVAHSFLRYRDDGTIIHIQGKPMPGVGYVTSFTDITELKKTEQELREINENLEKIVEGRTNELSMVNKELEQAIASKVQFLAAVNHDVMQPLNAARLFASALTQKMGDDQGLAGKITNSIRSAEEIIHTLLDVSKLDSGAVTANVSSFRINDILETLHEEFSLIAAKKHIELVYVPCSLVVESDAHLVRRLLQNLISNALRYTHSGGKVTIGCRRKKINSDKPELEIGVYDTGVGIRENELGSIFDEFKRLDNQIDDKDKGIGLGLAIARRISKIIDGRIRVSSVVSRGSVFSITLPISARQTNIQVLRPRRGVQDYSGRLPGVNTRILCIDNDLNVLDAMNAQLSAWSCHALCAPSYAQAMNEILITGFEPDLLLIDYHLDKENGIDVIRQLHASLNNETPAVLITADVSAEIKRVVFQHGFRYLSKPVNPAALRNLIVRLARKRPKVPA